MKNKISMSLVVLSLCGQITAGIPHLNLFNPYDWLVRGNDRAGACWQWTVGYEGEFNQRSYQADEDENGNSNCFRKRADVLQLYQDEQDLLAALKGDEFTTELGQLSTKFNLNDDDGTYGLFIPCGSFNVHNILLSARYYLSNAFYVSAHLPIVSMELKDVAWNPSPKNTNQTFDSQITEDLVTDIEQIGNINLHNWKRTGVGDLALMGWWGRDFHQTRPFLQNVYLGLRGGLIFPTGKDTDENVMLGLPFGHDAGVGILGGGHLEMTFCDYYHFGIDGELLHLFGETRDRRIKTDAAQTDLVFLSKVCAFAEPGFTQHFTLYLGAEDFCWGLSTRLAYQYTRQQEDKLFLGSDHFDSVTANSAESLQDWTTHSLVFNIAYDFYREGCDPAFRPHISFFVKHGFNGSRAILADTIGGVLSVAF